jgi:hypothetical protein
MVFEDSGDSRGVAEVLLELGRVARAGVQRACPGVVPGEPGSQSEA